MNTSQLPPRHTGCAAAGGATAGPSSNPSGCPAEIVPTVDAHRRLAGAVHRRRHARPGTGSDRAREPTPTWSGGHDIELLSVAPELQGIVPNSRQTLTSMALPAERTRFYARLRTRRIANGLVEFVRDGLPTAAREPSWWKTSSMPTRPTGSS